MKIPKAIGILIIISLVLWIIASFASSSVLKPSPSIFGIDAAAQSNILIPKAEIDAAIATAKTSANTANSYGNAFSLAENVFKWLAVLASAVITLIGGMKGGLGVNGSEKPKVDLSELPRRYVRVVTILASISAVSVALSATCQSEKQSFYEKSDNIIELIYQARKDVTDAKDVPEAEKILNEMILEAQR